MSRYKRPTLYVMSGIPGSGKSTEARKIFELTSALIVNTDDIRKMMYGDAAVQGNGSKVFAVAHNHIAKELYQGKDVIFDATNITTYSRKQVVTRYRGNVKLVCVYMDTPVEICKERNSRRERFVPEDVIDSMHMRASKPTRDEGFDVIRIIKA